MPFFSLIIPVHNTESYIARCLESCINQTFRDIEIIIVDDCGNDNSMQIVQEYAKKDKRIKIIHNPKNLGTFRARIEGMKNICGDYVLFVDADDCIVLEACEILYSAVHQEDRKLDIVIFNIDNCDWDPIISDLSQDESKNLQKVYQSSICARAYSREIVLKSLEMIEKYFSMAGRILYHEDILKSFILLYFVKNYLIITDILYIYCFNENSITRRADFAALRLQIRNKRTLIKLFDIFQKIPYQPYEPSYKDFNHKSLEWLKESLEHNYDTLINKRLLQKYSFRNYFLLYIRCFKKTKTLGNFIRLLVHTASFGRLQFKNKKIVLREKTKINS